MKNINALKPFQLSGNWERQHVSSYLAERLPGIFDAIGRVDVAYRPIGPFRDQFPMPLSGILLISALSRRIVLR